MSVEVVDAPVCLALACKRTQVCWKPAIPDLIMLLTFLLLLVHHCEGKQPSVSLTVEGGVNLAGLHCPGTVRLFCEATDLSGLRWTYNGSVEIITYFSDSVPFSQTDQSLSSAAFPDVSLTAITPNPGELGFANFSSLLVADLANLEALAITDITCGDGLTFETEEVNVRIRNLTSDNPNITNVESVYSNGILSNLQVTWKRINTSCPTYEVSLVYQVNLSGAASVQVHQANCSMDFCTVNFSSFSLNTVEEYHLSIQAINMVFSSGLVNFPILINPRSETYVTSVLSQSCQIIIMGQCGISSPDFVCFIQYTEDSNYSNEASSNLTNSTVKFPIVGLETNTTYFFDIQYLSGKYGFTAMEKINITTQTIPNPDQSLAVSLLVVSVILWIIYNILFAIIGLVFCHKKSINWTCIGVMTFVHGILFCIMVSLLVSFGIFYNGDSCDKERQGKRDGLIITVLVFSLLEFAIASLPYIIWYCIHLKTAVSSKHSTEGTHRNTGAVNTTTEASAAASTSQDIQGKMSVHEEADKKLEDHHPIAEGGVQTEETWLQYVKQKTSEAYSWLFGPTK